MTLKLCGIIIICFASVLIAKGAGSSIGVFIPIAALICILGIVAVSLNRELEGLFFNIENHMSSEYVLILLKALGITVISGVTAEICSSCGENLLSNIAVFSGKAEILILCIPMIRSILELAGTKS